MAGDVRDEGRRMGLGLQCAASYQRHAHSEKGGRRRKKRASLDETCYGDLADQNSGI
jgi:hypothetical protein